MSPTQHSVPCEKNIFLMFKSLETCCRLDSWSERPTESPLIALAQSHVRKLITEVRAIGVCVISLKISDPYQIQRHITPRMESLIRRVRVLIFEAFDILDFSLRHERDGDDGALNAVFASLFILGEHREDGFSVGVNHNKIKMLRLAEECAKIHPLLSKVMDAFTSSENSVLRKPLSELDGFIELQQAPFRFADSVLKHTSPRYVHAYTAATDPPYKIDTSVDPVAGSWGVVQKVVHKTTGDSFARKTFRNVFSNSDRTLILRELGVMELCHHGNIITLMDAYEVVEEPHTIHLVMAPWAPDTLHQFLHSPDATRTRAFPWFGPGQLESDMRIYGIMRELADAVGYLHSLSVKHKDIKPDNILLYTDDDHVIPYLTDVGVSKVYRPGTKTNFTGSTYPYLSLEQLDLQESSLKSDIWQLGCCFAMLLAVARGGTAAMDELAISYQRTDEACSCNIAVESMQFMETLNSICASGNSAQDQAHWVVTRMLDLKPSTRFDIETVRMELKKLP